MFIPGFPPVGYYLITCISILKFSFIIKRRPHSQIICVSVMRVIFLTTSSFVTIEPFCKSPDMRQRLPIYLSIFAHSFKGFQIATFWFVGVFCCIYQRHIRRCNRPFFPGYGRRISYFVMSVPCKLKSKIGNLCFCSHIIMNLCCRENARSLLFHATNIR